MKEDPPVTNFLITQYKRYSHRKTTQSGRSRGYQCGIWESGGGRRKARKSEWQAAPPAPPKLAPSFLGEFDFEEFGPVLAGDEEAVVLGVIGNAVEDIGLEIAGVDDVGGGQQAGEVDPSDDFAGLGIDAGDAVGLPDVGVDLAFDQIGRASCRER